MAADPFGFGGKGGGEDCGGKGEFAQSFHNSIFPAGGRSSVPAAFAVCFDVCSLEQPSHNASPTAARFLQPFCGARSALAAEAGNCLRAIPRSPCPPFDPQERTACLTGRDLRLNLAPHEVDEGISHRGAEKPD
jgi:hypothetical protein